MSIWAVILAAGSGTRLAAAGLSSKKQFLPYRGAPLFWQSARTFAHVAPIDGLVFVFPKDDYDEGTAQARALLDSQDIGLPWCFATGGKRRQDSVYNALTTLPADCTQVLIHDAARPFASAKLCVALLEALKDGAKACIPVVPVTDTIKRVQEGTVTETLPRSELAAVQTPQAFDLALLRRAHEFCLEKDLAVTDDASMVEAMGQAVSTVPGEATNIKITTPEDLKMLEPQSALPVPITGWGYDVHKYGEGRPMVLGSVPIQGAPQVVAHSDGDVLLHALADALLGCLGKGDIGQHFPDTDAKFAGIESSLLVKEVLLMAEEKKLVLTHVDLTLICQVPKLSPWRDQIKKAVANLLRLPLDQVNIKATTEEGLGFTGNKQGIKAVACVSALRAAALIE